MRQLPGPAPNCTSCAWQRSPEVQARINHGPAESLLLPVCGRVGVAAAAEVWQMGCRGKVGTGQGQGCSAEVPVLGDTASSVSTSPGCCAHQGGLSHSAGPGRRPRLRRLRAQNDCSPSPHTPHHQPP